MLGYSRVGSQSRLRALRTWPLKGFAKAGSTGLPVLGVAPIEYRGSSVFADKHRHFYRYFRLGLV